MRSFKAAIFDLDGVIADTAQAHYLAWAQLANQLGIYFDEEINERLKGVPRMASLDIVLENAIQSFSDAEKEKLATEKNRYYLDIVNQMTPNDLLPGAREAIVKIRQAGLKTALASASKNAISLISYLDIGDLLDYVADANFITHHKPHPEIFLKAAEGLDVEPENCIAFEDAVAGIEAIRAANIFAVGIGEKSVLTRADIVFSSLSDIPRSTYAD